MKETSLSRPYQEYITNHTTPLLTRKIEASLEAIHNRRIEWMSEETEILLSQKLKDTTCNEEDVTAFINSLCKMHIANVEWMKFKGIDVYFSPEAY